MPTANQIPPLTDAQQEEAMKFAMAAIERIPQGNPQVVEAHLVGVLVVFWGALWGTMGTEYARGFIESQLRGMKPEVPRDIFTKPRMQ